jgi:hypothetical protein
MKTEIATYFGQRVYHDWRPLNILGILVDRLCGLVVRVPDYREIVGLERGPLSLVSTIEELLERKSSCFGLEIREYSRRDPSR